MDYIDDKSKIHPEDREKVKQLYKKAEEATVEIREFGEDGDIKHSVLEFTKIVNEDGKPTLIGSTRDITEQTKHEKKLKERARKDSLTGLYNQVYGKKCINKYLNRKKPFDSCGMIVLDVDCFKSVNDNYGHLFGDKVLARLAILLKEVFRDNDSILMRAGGDEFVIFVKDVLNIELVRKNVELMHVKEQMDKMASEAARRNDSAVSAGADEPVSSNAVESKRSKLNQDEYDALLKRIYEVMRNPEYICNPDFSVEQLVSVVGTKYKTVLDVIHDDSGYNFSAMLNKCRIEEACRRINEDDQTRNYTVEAIAGMVGYRSRNSFTAAFKRITGLYPSEYIRIARERL